MKIRKNSGFARSCSPWLDCPSRSLSGWKVAGPVAARLRQHQHLVVVHPGRKHHTPGSHFTAWQKRQNLLQRGATTSPCLRIIAACSNQVGTQRPASSESDLDRTGVDGDSVLAEICPLWKHPPGHILRTCKCRSKACSCQGQISCQINHDPMQRGILSAYSKPSFPFSADMVFRTWRASEMVSPRIDLSRGVRDLQL